MMSTKKNEELIRRFFEICSGVQGDMVKLKTADWDSIFSPGYVIHFTNRDMNLEQLIEYNAGILSAFPDMRFTVDDIFAAGDKVAARYSMKGTFKNAYRGIPPTGKQVMVKGASIDRFVKGRSLETWDYPDMLSVMVQLGVIPNPSSKM
jgi:predicted ester cyclase